MIEIEDLTKSLPVHKTKKPSIRKVIKRLVVHTTDWETTPQRLAEYDIGPNHISQTGCPTITYTYLIGRAGEVFKTTNHEVVTWHVGNWNSSSLGIALLYKTDPAFEKAVADGKPRPKVDPRHLPSKEQMESLEKLLLKLCLDLKIPPTKVMGHRELAGTGHILNSKGSKVLRKTCPGMGIDLDVLRYNVTCKVQAVLKDKRLYEGKIDGDWGPKSKEAFSKLG